ncbi:hypothetical protein LELG_03411 [Lodderomyces elongisporus NRRL YB-4239]|uniref:Nucleoporin NUP49/NSP49 n=1 Tax=Lodderomyces elongisporus (strain ATCC 11503 / CBS 2605 / JCM 1781 / NBRC 1676 / NRRL YB-4239) TaxID=379508 RepID=A5E1C4_LODEL|nr:hypothetical protein LELG_03411 [Lodderomyces elongisporus NRRL YB-4239]
MFGQASKPSSSFGGFGSSNTNTNIGTASGGNGGGGGGLFGAKPATSTGGLFGQSNTQQGNTSGGLFGSNPGATNIGTGGGLFGQNQSGTTGTSGGLFGGQQNQQNQPSTTAGGLFGQSNQQLTGQGTGTSTGLFGANKPASSGLFGNTGGTSGGGLFGNTQTGKPSSGLFGGNSSNTTQSSGGLFGNNTSNQSNSGGLFGSSNTQSSGGGLFGNKPATSGGGLFGLQQQLQQQPQQQQQQQQQQVQLTAMTRVGDLPPEIKNELQQLDTYINTQHLIATTLNSDMSKHNELVETIPKDINYLQNKLLSTKQALKFDTSQLLALKTMNNEVTEDINNIMQLIIQLSTPGTKLSSSYQLNEFFIKKIKNYHEMVRLYEETIAELEVVLNGLERNCNEGFGNLASIIQVIKTQYALFMELCETMAQLHNEVKRLQK